MLHLLTTLARFTRAVPNQWSMVTCSKFLPSKFFCGHRHPWRWFIHEKRKNNQEKWKFLVGGRWLLWLGYGSNFATTSSSDSNVGAYLHSVRTKNFGSLHYREELVTCTFWPHTRKPMGIMRFWFLGSTIKRLPQGTMYVSNLSSSSHARNTGGKLKSAKKKRWIFCIWAFYSGMVRIKRILLVAVVKWNKKEGRHAFWSHYA